MQSAAAIIPRYLSRSKLARYLDVSESTVARMVADGRLPRPIMLSDDLPRWDRDAVDAALSTRRGGVITDPATIDDIIRGMTPRAKRNRNGR